LYWNFTPQKDKTYTFTKYVGIATSIDKERVEALGTAVPQTFADDETSVNDAADGTAKEAKLKGFDALLAEHKDAWEALWNKSSITVENPRLQQIINSAQFELLSSTYEGSRASIPVSGLVGTGYGGMIFWDAETWMYPYLLLTHPELAKSIVDYRFDTLPAARQNLNSSDFVNDEGTKPYKGAYFPWVSGVGVMENGIGERERRQLHLQGDIALAQYQYYAATGDTNFLRDQVWPIVSDIADFYTTRGNYNADGLFTLTNVTGPDEYASNVTTEAYNNAVAIEAFNIAIKTAKLLDLPAPETWTNARDEMVRPLLDPSRQTHLQYEGFNLANPNNKIKQADVVLLSYPLEYPMTKEQATNNLEYYSSAADRDGPAMTDAVHAVIAAQLGSCDFGTFMKKSYDAALGPYVHFNETRAVGPSGEQTAPANIFVTAAGGFLQGVGMGMTGYRFHDDRIVLSPILPESIEEAPAKRAYFKGLKWQGREFNVDIGATDTWVTLTSGGDAPLEVTADGGVEKFTLKKDVPLKLQTRKAAKADGTPCDPLPSSDLIQLP
ncbi:MAG TPA: glycosyl hydrolase family 65 protein, partial [Phyllobacterium sp.]|nr:glycosyl hydrolase family 65 protein [Phyllobacterium sp.]